MPAGKLVYTLNSAFWIEIAESGSIIGSGQFAAPFQPRKTRAILQYLNEDSKQPIESNFSEPTAVIGNVPWLNQTDDEFIVPSEHIRGINRSV